MEVFQSLGEDAQLPLALEVWLNQWSDRRRKQLQRDMEKGQALEVELRQRGRLLRLLLQPLPDGSRNWLLRLEDRPKERQSKTHARELLQKEVAELRTELNRWTRWLGRWPEAILLLDNRLQGVVATPAFRKLAGLKRAQWEGAACHVLLQQPEWAPLYQAATRCSVDRKPRELGLTLKEKYLKAYCHPLVEGLLIRLEPQAEEGHTHLLAEALWKLPGVGLLLSAEGKVLACSAQAPQLWQHLFA